MRKWVSISKWYTLIDIEFRVLTFLYVTQSFFVDCFFYTYYTWYACFFCYFVDFQISTKRTHAPPMNAVSSDESNFLTTNCHGHLSIFPLFTITETLKLHQISRNDGLNTFVAQFRISVLVHFTIFDELCEYNDDDEPQRKQTKCPTAAWSNGLHTWSVRYCCAAREHDKKKNYFDISYIDDQAFVKLMFKLFFIDQWRLWNE